jgi:hypothetical protein
MPSRKQLRQGREPLTPSYTSRLLFFLLETPAILHGGDRVGAMLSQALMVEVLDILSEWHLPRLLVVIVQFAELPRVQAELTSHLELGMRKVMALACVDPFAFRFFAAIQFASPLWEEQLVLIVLIII